MAQVGLTYQIAKILGEYCTKAILTLMVMTLVAVMGVAVNAKT